MKAILISVQPQWVAKILNGEKTLEIRKSMPKCDLPIDVYIYVTKGDKKSCLEYADNPDKSKDGKWCITSGYPYANGKVVAKFTLNKVEEIECITRDNGFAIERYITKELSVVDIMEKSCLYFEDLKDYLYYSNGYAIHITKLEIFDKPKELREFRKHLSTGNCWNCKIFGNGCITCAITKAPQSWCYVEV